MVATSSANPKGVPHELNTAINHLSMLLKNLPTTLPLDPSDSTYEFGLDNTNIEEEGLAYAFNHCMEIAFQTHSNPIIRLKERGSRYGAMIQLFHAMAKRLSKGDRDFHLKRWIDRLTDSAQAAGAKIPNKRRVDLPSDSEDSQPHALKRGKGIGKFFSNQKHDAGMTMSASNSLKSTATVINLVSDDEHEGNKEKLTPLPMEASFSQTTQPASQTISKQQNKGHAAARTDPNSDAEKDSTGKRQQTLFELGARRATMAEVLETQKKLTARYQTNPKEIEEWEAHKKAKRLQRKRDLGRARIQRFREKKKTTKSKAKAILLGYDQFVQEKSSLHVAEVSRVGSAWKQKRNGKNNGVMQIKHSRVNWYHPFLWVHIDRIAPAVGWSPQLIVSTLRKDMPELFSGLHRGTVFKWISKNNKRRWSTATTKNVQRRHALAGTGRVGVLTPYPELVQEIKNSLADYRKSGISVDGLLTRSVILALLQERQPVLLKSFKCSEFYVRQFLQSVMDWTVRRGTRAAAHIPANASELCERTTYRIVHLVNFYDIPVDLLIGMDQTGVIVLMTSNKTYAQKGVKQVDIAGRDEKRAYTLCVATTPTGNILPFQQVWSGKTRASLPSARAEGMDDASELGFDFAAADSKKKTSHFSTLKTMKEWMTNILQPYIASYIELHHLPDDQKAILLIDCYPVHIGQEFRTYVFEKFPNIFLVFIPANCMGTGIFQPANVGLNRICKHFLRQRALEFLVKSHSKQIKDGLTADHVKFTTSLPTLRDASVAPVVDLYNFLSAPRGRDIIRQAWEMCKVFDLNLGEDCLTSKKTKALYREYLRHDETLRKEIEAKLGLGALDDTIEPMEPEADVEEDEFEEEASEIPLEVVIRYETGIAVYSEHESDPFCVAAESVTNVDGVLQPGGDAENIWAYRDDGETWSGLLAS